MVGFSQDRVDEKKDGVKEFRVLSSFAEIFSVDV